MQKWVIGLGAVAVLTGAKMLAHPANPTDLASRAALYATGIQAIAPKAVDSAATITGAHAEDKTVVVAVRVDAVVRSSLDAVQTSRMYGAMACKQAPIGDFIRAGGSFRYDLMRTDGSLYDSVSITSCEGLSPS